MYPGLPIQQVSDLKTILFHQFPQYWKSKHEFESVWKTCVESLGLTSRRMNSFNSCQRFSMGLRSGDSAGVLHQLMLGVIILHEFVTIRKACLDEGKQRLTKYLYVQLLFHYPFENTISCSPSFTDSGPNVDFRWMLGSAKE